MEILKNWLGKKIYLDTNVFIYALEGYPAFIKHLTALFEAIDCGDIFAVTSELSLAESLVKPILDQNEERQAVYKQTIQTSRSLQVVPIYRNILLEAAFLRANSALRMPDAIHVATAKLNECQYFLTNDLNLKTPFSVTAHYLSSWALAH